MNVLLRVPQGRGDHGSREGVLRPLRSPYLPDVEEDNAEQPRKLKIRIKASTTDPFREGMDVYLGWTGQPLCLVSATIAYLVRRNDGPGPLFLFEDGRPLTRPLLVREVRAALEEAGASNAGVSGHSFRIGAATTAAE